MNKIQIILRQFCTALMLTAALTIPALAASPTFSDVPDGSALQESVSCLVERGITNGTGTDTFSPNAPITVRQWAVMLCRAYGAEIHGENWRERSQNCVETAYAHGWLNETAVQAPDTRLCRSSLLESGLRTAGVPVYNACLFPGNESLSVSENIIRVGRKLSLCAEGASAAESVTRGEAAQLLYAVLTRELTVEAPPTPVALVNAAGVNINDYLLALRQVPEPMLAAFNVAGWTYRIDFDYISELSKQLNMSCIGATNYSQKTIYLSDASATLHEFGHFLDGQLGFPAEHEHLYLAEAQNSGLRDYAKTNAREYFADCFAYWIAYRGNEKRMETFRNAAPQTWAYFEALEKNNWIG
ncbi:anthrax toxin lethal factor-related metalloendopeptidase [Intestinimonas butyriciproducens]|uniref:anthrax toxin lethal factor-related metalloendopeptidase n=1 Tax=Intestinimonas butyriciproducens TaxID=1297617 RepID=UPI00095E3072|nr:S-layer homology domain-containing protein [Intestinimonas butyriciproducens]OLR66955.1 hypothetical protein BIV19_04745 [Intestinimonas butyriciproducens]